MVLQTRRDVRYNIYENITCTQREEKGKYLLTYHAIQFKPVHISKTIGKKAWKGREGNVLMATL